ncbi:MAG: UDP-N-acetylmuramate dehydrogenase [Corallococcus sp.]|nr:UDP-N-acetylmuramate dehydrogenase [Corallococcus sp.]
MNEAEVIAIEAKMKKYSVPTCANVPFAGLTTLGCGGTIKLVVYPKSERQLARVIRLLTKSGVCYCVVGHGSNILASDDEFDGVAVSTNNVRGYKIRRETAVVSCGTSTLTFANALRRYGLSGGEFFACLPASVGGAIVTNAGCYGQNVSDVLQRVTVIYKGKLKRLRADECMLAKRDSLFKNNSDYVILSAVFKFNKSSSQEVNQTIAEMRAKKARSQPLNYRSAGCVLYHDKAAVSKLLDEMGFKGVSIGGAQVSDKHAGFVLNVDKAKSKDIYLLIRRMQSALNERYGICAKIEVCMINFTKDDDDIFSKR